MPYTLLETTYLPSVRHNFAMAIPIPNWLTQVGQGYNTTLWRANNFVSFLIWINGSNCFVVSQNVYSLDGPMGITVSKKITFLSKKQNKNKGNTWRLTITIFPPLRRHFKGRLQAGVICKLHTITQYKVIRQKYIKESKAYMWLCERETNSMINGA